MTIIRPEDLDFTTLLSFNTGRDYSDDGQHIYACKTRDGLYTVMVDTTRGLEYVYNCPLDRTGIMHRYDNNMHLSGIVAASSCARALIEHHNNNTTPTTQP